MAAVFYSVLKSMILRGGAYEGAWKSGGGKNRLPEERHLKSVCLSRHDAVTYLQILHAGLGPQKWCV